MRPDVSTERLKTVCSKLLMFNLYSKSQKYFAVKKHYCSIVNNLSQNLILQLLNEGLYLKKKVVKICRFTEIIDNRTTASLIVFKIHPQMKLY